MAETRVLTNYDDALKGLKRFSPLTHVDAVFYEDGKYLSDKLSDLNARIIEGYKFIGKANFDTVPGIPKSKVYYIATELGVYSKFNLSIDKEGTYAFMFDPHEGKWSKKNMELHITTNNIYDKPTNAQLSDTLITSLTIDEIDEIDEPLRNKVLIKEEQFLSKDEKMRVKSNIGINDDINNINKSINIKFNELDEKINTFENGIREQINSYKPIQITGNVTNAPDEEDLTEIPSKSSGNKVLKFKDRLHGINGMGYKILRRKNGSNLLIQDMFKDIGNHELVNTIFEIRYDFDLGGNEISIPSGSILKFNGGSLSNGTLVLNKNRIIPMGYDIKELIPATITGTYKEGQIVYDTIYKKLKLWNGIEWTNLDGTKLK